MALTAVGWFCCYGFVSTEVVLTKRRHVDCLQTGTQACSY